MTNLPPPSRLYPPQPAWRLYRNDITCNSSRVDGLKPHLRQIQFGGRYACALPAASFVRRDFLRGPLRVKSRAAQLVDPAHEESRPVAAHRDRLAGGDG